MVIAADRHRLKRVIAVQEHQHAIPLREVDHVGDLDDPVPGLGDGLTREVGRLHRNTFTFTAGTMFNIIVLDDGAIVPGSPTSVRGRESADE